VNRDSVAAVYVWLVIAASLIAAPVLGQGAIDGTVVGADGRPVESAAVRAVRTDRSVARDALTDTAGRFRLTALTAGTYAVTVHRVGYRSAELAGVRVADGQTQTLTVALTQAATRLSTIEVVTSPTAVDASTPALTIRLDRTFTELVPSARDASSLIALVPGSRKDQLWGAAPGAANNYQVDGVEMNHPGTGGDFLGLSVDWIQSLEITGLGAGAEHGNFQGGIINAVTKSGNNNFRSALRTNHESPKLTATNLNANEIGSEQAGRTELSGEARGPIVRDRLFYFLAAEFIKRDVRAPDLTTTAEGDFQPQQERHRDARGIAKLTWLPGAGQRLDAMGGWSGFDTERAGVNGVDDPSSLARVRQPAKFGSLAYTNSRLPRMVLDARLAGFASQDTRTGYEGGLVPGVQLLQLGRMPTHQNVAFDEFRKSGNTSGSIRVRMAPRALGTDHELLLGADFTNATWRHERTRNGGLTWRPYTYGVTGFDPDDVATWGTVGSDWGGETILNSVVNEHALFVQDKVAIGPRITLTPGIRRGAWSGTLNPAPFAGPSKKVVAATAFDPRVGVAWDVTGRNTLALKAHWGRYHQGMLALLFDRAEGGNVYTNSRFYYSAPNLANPKQTFTPQQRDAPGSGFSTFFDEAILNETGRVEKYRQPYVDQLVLAAEKSLGSRWKVEATYAKRSNRDIVGLVDRNMAANYSPIHDVLVDHRFATGRVLDVNGRPLMLPVVWVSNQDLRGTLFSCGDSGTAACGGSIGGYTAVEVAGLTFDPDLALTTIPQARREYWQFTLLVRTEQSWWRAEGSLSLARLRGNTPGVMGYGGAGGAVSALPFARPNEAINFEGTLPDAQELDARVWATAQLPWSFRAGALWTHTYGETFAPTFAFNGRYLYSDAQGTALPYTLFRRILGQSVFVEPRGSRHYPSRDLIDLHLEWRSPGRMSVTMDLFNALGSNAITLINTNIGDQTASDPTSYFAATRLRAAPRALRAGLRIE
jgi:hypothetical protein